MERSLLPEGGGGEQFVSRVGGLGHYLPCPPQGPGGMQVVEGWQIAADRLLCRADDTLQPALMLGCDVPDGDVEVLHSSYWGVTQSDGAAFVLKSTTISTVFRALSSSGGAEEAVQATAEVATAEVVAVRESEVPGASRAQSMSSSKGLFRIK